MTAGSEFDDETAETRPYLSFYSEKRSVWDLCEFLNVLYVLMCHIKLRFDGSKRVGTFVFSQ